MSVHENVEIQATRTLEPPSSATEPPVYPTTPREFHRGRPIPGIVIVRKRQDHDVAFAYDGKKYAAMLREAFVTFEFFGVKPATQNDSVQTQFENQSADTPLFSYLKMPSRDFYP